MQKVISSWRANTPAVLVVDNAVKNADLLLSDLGFGTKVVTLNDGDCPLARIADAVRGLHNVPSLHILSHGEPGALLLAGGTLDTDVLKDRDDLVSAIGSSLADDASVVLYGCSVAAGTKGEAFIETLEVALGARVAASNAPVGATALGGSWTLKDRTGATVAPLFGDAARAAFPGVLASVTGTSSGDVITGSVGADTISALSGNDTVSALDGSDLILGDSGNDTLYGGGGDDTLWGGIGNDFLYGQTGSDILYGEDGNDAVSGADGADTLYGGRGNDTVIGSSGADLLYGGDGNDWIWGGKGDDVLSGGAGTDTMSGGDGADTLYGGASNDTLSGFSGNDVLFGGDGDDVLRGGNNTDTLSGGAGNDTFTGTAANMNGDTIADFTIGDTIIITSTDLTSLNGTAATGTISVGGGTLTLTGISSSSGNFNATLNGSNTEITLVAATTTDTSTGSSDGDTVTSTSTGSDGVVTTTSSTTNTTGTSRATNLVENTNNNGNTVTATLPSNVSLESSGPQTAQSVTDATTTLVNAIDNRDAVGESALITNANNFLNTLGSTASLDVRTIVIKPAITNIGGDPIVISGSSGSSQSEAFVIDLSQIANRPLQLDNIEFASIIGNATVTGGAGNNYVIGDSNAQFISLGEGDDTLYGGDGNDTIGSANGNDILYGNQGSDTVMGGSDSDTVYGGKDSDVVYGNTDNDVLYGNLANDTLYGGQGNDTLYGGQNEDILSGNYGDDVFITGLGADTISIGASEGNDTVTDFDGAGGDVIQILADANGRGLDTVAEILAAATDDGAGNVKIALGGDNSITLMGVSSTQLQSDWFTIV